MPVVDAGVIEGDSASSLRIEHKLMGFPDSPVQTIDGGSGVGWKNSFEQELAVVFCGSFSLPSGGPFRRAY